MKNKTLTQIIYSFAERHSLIPKAVAIIHRIFTSDPARAVESRGDNLRGYYPSQKIGLTVQHESAHFEMARIILLENDPRVALYCDQPSEKVQMRRPSASGRQCTYNATADFFVVSEEFVGWEEVKPESTLRALAKSQPHHYVNDNGAWICPPGQAYAATCGLGFRVISDRDLPRILIHNLEFLKSYQNAAPSLHLPEIRAHVDQNLGISLLDLREHFPNIPAEDFFEAIAAKSLYVDLHNQKLKYQDQVRVYSNEALGLAHRVERKNPSGQPERLELRVGTRLLFGESAFRVIALDSQEVKLLADGGFIQNLHLESLRNEIETGGAKIIDAESLECGGVAKVLSSTKAELDEAVRRLRLTESGRELISARSERRWRKRQRESILTFGPMGEFCGLIPDIGNRGNYGCKLSQSTVEHLDHFIEHEFESSRNSPIAAAYVDYFSSASKKNITPVSSKTFRRYIRRRDKSRQVGRREGKRAAYQVDPFLYLSYDSDRHGTHPWHVGHIDHTELDVITREGDVVGRAWLTIFTLSYSRRVVAFRLSYDAPSSIALEEVMLSCIELHGRLPEKIITDNGPEFRSGMWRTICGLFNIHLIFRPPHKPRAGSVIERLFGTTNTVLIHGLRGNTQILKKVRQVTKSRHPIHESVWSLPALSAVLAEFFFEIYDKTLHTGINATPREMHAHGLLTFGIQHSRQIVLTENARILLLPQTARPEQKIHRGGIIISGRYYWHSDLRALEGMRGEVRYDPQDYSVAYINVDRRWIRCVSDDRAVCQGMTAKEFEFLSKVYRENHRRVRRLKSVPTSEMLEFVRSIRAQEHEALQIKQETNFLAMKAARRQTLDQQAGPNDPTITNKISDIPGGVSTAYEEVIAMWKEGQAK